MSRRPPPRLLGNSRTTDSPRGRPILLRFLYRLIPYSAACPLASAGEFLVGLMARAALLSLLLIPTESYPQSVLLADGISSKAFEGALAPFPSAEKLSYDIEWRLIYAGSALLSLAPKPADPRQWDSQLRV